MFKKYNLEYDPEVQQEIERSRMPDELSLRIMKSQNGGVEGEMFDNF